MNARVTFSVSPWLLLLILPVFAAIFALFLVGKKKGSRVTVNRILAAVFQCAAATCCIFALAGVRIESDEANAPKELVILVDRSDTADGQRETMNGFVSDVLHANAGRCRVAVVLFGYGQKVAVKMGNHDASAAYSQYLAALAGMPAEQATDIASALRLAWNPMHGATSLISDPSRAKVLVLSDGLETDGDALGAMKTLTRDGVQIDTSFFADEYTADAAILGVEYPAGAVYAGKEIELAVTIKSSFAADTVLTYRDLDENGKERRGGIRVGLKAGTQELTLKHSFSSAGFHKIDFTLDTLGDETGENNKFCSFFDVTESDRILVFETYQNESALLRDTLAQAGGGSVVVETKALGDAGSMTADDLSVYSEVILYNSAQKDMTEEFQRALYRYVNELGGGLFTVGGFSKDAGGDILMQPKLRQPDVEVPVRNSYQQEDGILSSMLPVTIEEYKSPVAVVFVFDLSSSMATPSGPLHRATADTRHVLDNVLDPRDYAGVVTLQDSYAETEPLRPVTQKEILKESIAEFDDFYDFNAPTCYAPALQQAANMLMLAPDNVVRKHIVLLSDGGPGDKLADYGKAMEEAAKQGITITVVTYYRRTRVIDGELCYFNHDYDVKGYEINIGNMEKLAEYGNGSHVLIPRTAEHGWEEMLRKDMRLDETGDIGYESYSPRIGDLLSETLGDVTNLDLKELTLGGYFPSRRKVGDGVSVPLLANGSPLYAQWAFGNGKVGSIMIDLEGVWSEEIFQQETGLTIVKNIVNSLMRRVEPPTPSTEVMLTENNFSTQVNVYGFEPNDTAKLVAFVHSPDGTLQKFDLSDLSLGGNRFVFENRQAGIYKVELLTVSAELDFSDRAIQSVADIPAGEIMETAELYRAFSYSKEYDISADPYGGGTRATRRALDEGDRGRSVREIRLRRRSRLCGKRAHAPHF